MWLLMQCGQTKSLLNVSNPRLVEFVYRQQAHMHMYKYIYMCVYYMCELIYIYIKCHVQRHTHMHAYTYINMHTHANTHSHIHTHTCTHRDLHIHAWYTYTHTPTHFFSKKGNLCLVCSSHYLLSSWVGKNFKLSWSRLVHHQEAIVNTGT